LQIYYCTVAATCISKSIYLLKDLLIYCFRNLFFPHNRSFTDARQFHRICFLMMQRLGKLALIIVVKLQLLDWCFHIFWISFDFIFFIFCPFPTQMVLILSLFVLLLSLLHILRSFLTTSYLFFLSFVIKNLAFWSLRSQESIKDFQLIRIWKCDDCSLALIGC
jgi:hypothetical protein